MTRKSQCFYALAAITSIFLGLAPGAIAQTLTHRYSFNDAPSSTTFTDSVGGAAWNGSLVGTAALDGSALQLDGTGGFATLPAGVISNYSQVSIDFWATLS